MFSERSRLCTADEGQNYIDEHCVHWDGLIAGGKFCGMSDVFLNVVFLLCRYICCKRASATQESV